MAEKFTAPSRLNAIWETIGLAALVAALLNSLPRLHLSCFVLKAAAEASRAAVICAGVLLLKCTPQINHMSSLHVQAKVNLSHGRVQIAAPSPCTYS